jgi:hypothetical protein
VRLLRIINRLGCIKSNWIAPVHVNNTRDPQPVFNRNSNKIHPENQAAVANPENIEIIFEPRDN